MTASQIFEIPCGSGHVRGTLALPGRASKANRLPAALICTGVLALGEEAQSLVDDLSERLSESGFAVARYEPRCADLILEDFHAHTADHDAEDAQLVFRWLAGRAEIETRHITLIGYSLGAIPAARLCTTGLRPWLVCLISPTTAEDLAGRMVKANGLPAVINPEHLPAAYLASLAEFNSAEEAATHTGATLLIHGAADRFAIPEVSIDYLRSFEHAQRTVRHVLIARAGHSFAADESRTACLDQVVGFLEAGEAPPSTRKPGLGA